MKQLTFVLLGCIFALSSCEKKETERHEALMASLNGIWVGVANPTDTIDFDQLENPEWFILKRGYEYRDGYLLPKPVSGVYSFRISGNSISLQNLLLSCLCSEKYVFSMNQEKDEFIIGDFIYRQADMPSRLIFRKIK